MKDLFLSYLYSFSHPFQYPRFLGVSNFGRFEHYQDWREKGIRPFDLLEGILISWVFYIISNFLLLSVFLLGNSFVDISDSFLIYPSSTFFIVWLTLGVILFPIRLGLSMFLWKTAIKVFSLPFIPEEELEKHINHALAHSTSSYVLCLIPVFGGILQETIWALYLFAALKNIYRLSTGQAISIISFFTVFIMLSFGCLAFFFVLAIEFL